MVRRTLHITICRVQLKIMLRGKFIALNVHCCLFKKKRLKIYELSFQQVRNSPEVRKRTSNYTQGNKKKIYVKAETNGTVSKYFTCVLILKTTFCVWYYDYHLFANEVSRAQRD